VTAEATKPVTEKQALERLRLPLFAAGLGITGVLWFGAGKPLLGAAFFATWQMALMILRAQSRSTDALREEQNAVEAIETASRALRAGIPLSGMLQILSQEARGEAGRAFREIVQRESLGEELGAAVRNVLLRSPISSLRAFGLSLAMQVSAGGNLADTTDRLAHSLVERSRVRRRARAIVAYSRAAAWVLSVTPVLAVVLMCSLVDGYAELLLNSESGNLMLALAALAIIAGLAAIQRLARIEPAPKEPAA
jgi:tight adherence protein B